MAHEFYAGLSYEQVVRQYARAVLAACVMRLQNQADAEDCFQNTFLKLYTKSPDFVDQNHLKAWLLRVAINECKKHFRDNRRHVPLDELYHHPIAPSDDALDISWALMRLEPKYREVLYLHYCEQYKVDEIAAILGKNSNTVKTMLHRGRSKLKSICGGDE